MAEQIHSYIKTSIVAATIIFACGGWVARTESLAASDKDQTVKIDSLVKDVHQLQVDNAKEIALKQSLLSAIVRMESKIDSIGKEQSVMKLDLNTTKSKVEFLTKDE